MRFVRQSSFEEFIRHYLERERRKHRQNPDLSGVPMELLMAEMRETWPGKLRGWFERGRWSVVSMDTPGDAMTLVCLDNPAMRAAGLVDGAARDNRIARTVVARAHETGLFEDRGTTGGGLIEAFRTKRTEAMRANWPPLRGGERLVLSSLNSGEKAENPSGSWYLHDGCGRLVAYLYAVAYENRPYAPIEALLAEEDGQSSAGPVIRQSALSEIR